MVDTDNFLDFWDLFNNELIGDTFLFIALGLIAIWYFGTKHNVPYQVNIMMSILLLGIFTIKAWDSVVAIWVFAILAVIFIAYYPIVRIMNRG